MPNRYWTGNAHATKQIDTLEITGAGAANDTITLTINTKDLIITVGTGTTTAQVAETIRDAWNANTRVDGTGSTTNTSNFGGQEHGEFAEITAAIYSTSNTIVRFIANKAGVPVTLTAAKTGTVTISHTASSQAATGPHHWNNTDNWRAGTAPTNGDIAVFQDGSVGVKYGLPTTGRVTLLVYQSYTGQMGLPEYNTENASKPYKEYRGQFLQFDDTGAADTTLTHTFGVGEGAGSPLINVYHTNTAASPNSLQASAIVYNTGTPQVAGTKALNLFINNEGNTGGTVTVLKGSVNLGRRYVTNFNSRFTTLNIGYANSPATDADVEVHEHQSTLTVNQNSGILRISEWNLASLTAARTLNISGGTCVVSDLTTSGTVNATLLNCTFIYNATKTITTLIVSTGATFDLEKDARAVTITNCDLFQGARLLDEFARGTYTNGIDLNRCGIDDVTLRVGNNRRLTLGTAA